MKMTVDYISYKNEGLYKILEYLNATQKEKMYIILDEDEFVDSTHLIFDTLKISDFKVEDTDEDDREHHASFTCTEEVEKNLIKLFLSIKYLGDGGHSYTIKINDKKFSWDGDGCDRITHINGKECKSASDLHKNFYDYTLRKIQSKNESIEEMIKRIVHETLN